MFGFLGGLASPRGGSRWILHRLDLSNVFGRQRVQGAQRFHQRRHGLRGIGGVGRCGASPRNAGRSGAFGSAKRGKTGLPKRCTASSLKKTCPMEGWNGIIQSHGMSQQANGSGRWDFSHGFATWSVWTTVTPAASLLQCHGSTVPERDLTLLLGGSCVFHTLHMLI